VIAATALLVIRVYNAFGVAPTDLEAARKVTEAVLHDVGIRLQWRDCTASDECSKPLGASERIVRIIAAPREGDPQSLGYSFVDRATRTGLLATAFADRVAAVAASAEVHPGQLLGRTIAHELGHLLEGSTDHAAAGLMRAHWTSLELSRNAPEDFRLSSEEGRLMRRALSDRPGMLVENERSRKGRAAG
jgi:hypothetical protein